MKTIHNWLKDVFRKLLKKAGVVTNRDLLKSIDAANQNVERLEGILRHVEWVVANDRLVSAEIFSGNTIFYGDAIKILERNGSNILRHNREIKLITDHKIAVESNDHIFPESTLEGLVRHPRLAKKAKEIFGDKMSFLDIGCGAGALVFDFAFEGILSIGIDGSDTCLKAHNNYWRVLPDNFFTCDITKKFSLTDSAEKTKQFELITSWEVLEHIPEAGLSQMLKNIYDHLADGGYFIGTASLLEYSNPKTGVVYHVTLQNKEWWSNLFGENGLQIIESGHPFSFNDFYRGVGDRYQDLHNYMDNPRAGFQFVAKKLIK